MAFIAILRELSRAMASRWDFWMKNKMVAVPKMAMMMTSSITVKAFLFVFIG